MLQRRSAPNRTRRERSPDRSTEKVPISAAEASGDASLRPNRLTRSKKEDPPKSKAPFFYYLNPWCTQEGRGISRVEIPSGKAQPAMFIKPYILMTRYLMMRLHHLHILLYILLFVFPSEITNPVSTSNPRYLQVVVSDFPQADFASDGVTDPCVSISSAIGRTFL